MPGVKFIVHNVVEPSPPEHHQKLEFVQVQLLNHTPKTQDFDMAVENIILILRRSMSHTYFSLYPYWVWQRCGMGPVGHLQWQENDALDCWANPDMVNARSTAAYVISERIVRGHTPTYCEQGCSTLGQDLSVDPGYHPIRNGNPHKLGRRPCSHHASRDHINHGSSIPGS